MSYKICKQTDDCIVLQDTGGIIDFMFNVFLAGIGAGVIYLGWFGYQDTGELFMPLIVALVGSCFFFNLFKRNRVTIDANKKIAIKTKSWFGITSNEEIINNSSLTLLEMSGFTTNELNAYGDDNQRINYHYSLKFYSYPEWQLAIRDFSTMINIVLFFEKHFDAELALVVQHQRHTFSTEGLLKNHIPTALPNNNWVRETDFQQLTIGGLPLTSVSCWLLAVFYIGAPLASMTMVLFYSGQLFEPYVPMAVQYVFAALFVGTFIGLFIRRLTGTRLSISHDVILVKNSLFSTRAYKRAEVVGVAKVAKITYLITQAGATALAYRLPTQSSYAIHSWLAQYIGK